MIVHVNIAKDKSYNLKKVIPDLHFTGQGDKVFSFDGDGRDGYDLTVVQARNGFDLHSPQGLGNFLLEVGVFSQGKADLLAKQSFRSIDRMYDQAARFVVQGRAAGDKEDGDTFILSLLELPFVDRCLKAQEIGFHRVLRIVLASIDKRFNPSTFATLSRTQKNYYQDVMGPFKKADFLELQTTGDIELDCVSILKCF